MTSNLQVVNTTQHRICERVRAHWGSAVTLYCTWKHVLMHLLQSACRFWMSYVQHVRRTMKRTTPRIPCMARLRWPTQSTPLTHPHLQLLICLLQYTHTHAHSLPPPTPPPMPLSNQWRVTGGTWLKVNVCRGKTHVITCRDVEGKENLTHIHCSYTFSV